MIYDTLKPEAFHPLLRLLALSVNIFSYKTKSSKPHKAIDIQSHFFHAVEKGHSTEIATQLKYSYKRKYLCNWAIGKYWSIFVSNLEVSEE